MMTETIVIAGGLGSFGSPLPGRLLADGCSVGCLGNLCTGSLANVAHVTGNPAFRVVRYSTTGIRLAGWPAR
jgi:UDP-glucose 4-epimerase